MYSINHRKAKTTSEKTENLPFKKRNSKMAQGWHTRGEVLAQIILLSSLRAHIKHIKKTYLEPCEYLKLK